MASTKHLCHGRERWHAMGERGASTKHLCRGRWHRLNTCAMGQREVASCQHLCHGREVTSTKHLCHGTERWRQLNTCAMGERGGIN